MGEDPVQKFWPFFTNELVCWIFFIIVIIINTIIIIIIINNNIISIVVWEDDTLRWNDLTGCGLISLFAPLDSKFECFIFTLWSDKLICRSCHAHRFVKILVWQMGEVSRTHPGGSPTHPDHPLWCKFLIHTTPSAINTRFLYGFLLCQGWSDYSQTLLNSRIIGGILHMHENQWFQWNEICRTHGKAEMGSCT